MFIFVFYISVCIIISMLFIKLFLKMLYNYNVFSCNFQNNKVINIMGISFVPIFLCLYMVLCFFLQINYKIILLLIFGISSMGFTGIIDDLVGNRKTTGLYGHFVKLLNGELTTGALKAIICFFSSIIISLDFLQNWSVFILNVLVICLSTNAVNLFDVRPGRAIKFVLFVSTIFLIIDISLLYYLLPLICMLGVYGNYDVKSYCMMGDTGANILGFILGFLSAIQFNILMKIVYCLFLIIIHLIAEKYSITEIIKNYKALNFLDKLGTFR